MWFTGAGVSDHGPPIESEMQKHIRCAPYHPSSNGAVERFIQAFKKGLRATGTKEATFCQDLMYFLGLLHTLQQV